MMPLPRRWLAAGLALALLTPGAHALAQSKTAAPAQAAPVPAESDAAARAADYIVAVVNTEPITRNEVRARMAQLRRGDAAAMPEAQLRELVLERLITERAQLQQARAMGIAPDDTALAQAELAIARQNQLASVEELHHRLQQEGIALDEFRADLRNQVMLAQLRAVEIEPGLKISDAEVTAFIREQTGATAQEDRRINLAMILVEVPESASASAQAELEVRAQDVARRARAGEDFAELALQYSDANRGGTDGGELGLRPVAEYPDLFVRSTQGTAVGGTVGPVRSDAGWHILKVLERRVNQELPDVVVPQTHVRHILLRAESEQDRALALARAADFKRRIEAGNATFADLARSESDDDSATSGGDLGWAPPGAFVPEFEQAMNNLDPGQISDPVVTRFGVHLIQVLDRQEQVLNAAQQRELARNVLREQKAAEAMQTWAEEARARAYIEYRDPPL